MKQNIVIDLENIGKKYRLLSHKSTLMTNIFEKNNQKEEFWALKNINLSIKRGDRIGIFGPNGSGKTTLLKIISGITKPTTGIVKKYGKITSLIDLEAGFHPDLSGYENILLQGLLIGMSKAEIQEKFNIIIEYSGIGDFINEPFYTYSSGMKFRLASAVAIASDADILIFDEIFIIGDLLFQNKILDNLKSLQKKRNLTTIIASHNPVALVSFADKYLFLENGKLYDIKRSEIIKLSLKTHHQFHRNFHTNFIFSSDKTQKRRYI